MKKAIGWFLFSVAAVLFATWVVGLPVKAEKKMQMDIWDSRTLTFCEDYHDIYINTSNSTPFLIFVEPSMITVFQTNDCITFNLKGMNVGTLTVMENGTLSFDGDLLKALQVCKEVF